MKLTLLEDKRNLRIDEITNAELSQLKLTLTKKVDNFQFMKKFRGNSWDGNVCFIKGGRFIPVGLWGEVLNMCREHKFQFDIVGREKLFRKVDKEHFENWINEQFQFDLKPRDYQIETAFKILQRNGSTAELATSAGKSLIIFIVLGYLIDNNEIEKFLMIVPSVTLVLQAINDFEEYNSKVKNPVFLAYQGIHAGEKIRKDCNVVIGTYQSLVKKEKDWFDQFQCVACDETHQAKNQSIQTIYEKVSAEMRFGVSGTVPKPGTLNRLSIFSHLGPLVTEIKASTLMESGKITPISIAILELEYLTEDKKLELKNISKLDSKSSFQREKDIVLNSQLRLNYICRLVKKFPKNCLVLFHRIEYGNFLAQKLIELCPEKQILYIDGGINKEIREDIKAEMEIGTNKILVASYGTLSTGVNITNLHALYLTESFKSEIIIRQSIGRGLRLHDNKAVLWVFDFVDNYIMKGYRNFFFLHGQERQKIYTEQKFKYQIKNVKL